jgi:hypothetical protein
VGRKKGAVLIVVLGVLVILALLATTFVTLQTTERQVARNYLDTVRAKLIAQSGVEDAATRLRDYFPTRMFEESMNAKLWKFWGDNLEEDQEPGVMPIEKAKNPSFACEDDDNPLSGSPRPRLINITVNGKTEQLGFSGVHEGGSYGASWNEHYVLKLSDLQGRINVNDGLEMGPTGSVSQNLKRILNVVGTQCSIPGLGDKILAARPNGGYTQMNQLLKAVNYDELQFAQFRDFVTVQSWQDNNACNPVPLSEAVLSEYPIKYYRGSGLQTVYRFGSRVRGYDAGVNAEPALINGDLMAMGPATVQPRALPSDPQSLPCVIYGLDTLNPQYIELVKRAPVNVNTAPLEVLVALLTDIKGFFITDRRRDNPCYDGDMYLSFKQKNSYSPYDKEGDEYGWLAQTLPIVGPGGTATGGISAFDIAKHLIACRNSKDTHIMFPGGKAPSVRFDYSAKDYKDQGGNTQPLWFTGQFRTWVQFGAFVDNLITMGLIKDTRALWFDYSTTGGADATGYSNLQDSLIQRNYAARAIADAIKANFNPNVHLNELNPDNNLFYIVDKTDLFVNSTEFTFMPTGYFEIEALGRVLKPQPGFTDARISPTNEIAAQAKIMAIYQLFQCYRETNQKDFYAGTFSDRGGVDTNNNRSLECGPEPDNGAPPGQNEWSGYLALPTVGGMGHDGATKPKNALWRTAEHKGSSHLNSALHVHFQLDHDCHHHMLSPTGMPTADDAIYEISSKEMPPHEYVWNCPDPGVRYPGPYNPTSGPAGSPHRLARWFRLEPGKTPPILRAMPPSDLRIDGAYAERHCAPSYMLHKAGQHVWNFDVENAHGMSSLWVKPSFDPERTGKIRTFWDCGKYHSPCGANVNVWPFASWYFPSHRESAADTNIPPKYSGNSIGSFQNNSITFGHKAWHDVPKTSEFGRVTCSLNHYHPDPVYVLKTCGQASPLRGRRWMNLTMYWKLDSTYDSAGDRTCKLLVNGVTGAKGATNTYDRFTYQTLTGWSSGYDLMYKMNNHDGGGGPVHLRIGSATKIGTIQEKPYRGNHSADFTVDELYVWANVPMDGGLPYAAPTETILWDRGRYYRPDDDAEGRFTSQSISFIPPANRVLPKKDTATLPSGGAGAPPPPSMTPVVYTAEPTVVRILGVSWTWYGEETLGDNSNPRRFRRTLYNWNNRVGVAMNGLPGADLMPRIELSILDGSTTYGPYEDDAFSAVRAADGTPPIMTNLNSIKYMVHFRLMQPNPGAILLATPVVDDVTIFWDDSRTRLLAYNLDNRSF